MGMVIFNYGAGKMHSMHNKPIFQSLRIFFAHSIKLLKDAIDKRMIAKSRADDKDSKIGVKKWTNWSNCSSRCGPGLKSRVMLCIKENEKCKDSIQTKPCFSRKKCVATTQNARKTKWLFYTKWVSKMCNHSSAKKKAQINCSLNERNEIITCEIGRVREKDFKVNEYIKKRSKNCQIIWMNGLRFLLGFAISIICLQLMIVAKLYCGNHMKYIIKRLKLNIKETEIKNNHPDFDECGQKPEFKRDHRQNFKTIFYLHPNSETV